MHSFTYSVLARDFFIEQEKKTGARVGVYCHLYHIAKALIVQSQLQLPRLLQEHKP